MPAWILLLVPSAGVDVLCAVFIGKKWAIYLAGSISWFGLLIALLYSEYYIDYPGGGASMWSIAQLFAGTIATVIGVAVYKGVQKYQREITYPKCTLITESRHSEIKFRRHLVGFAKLQTLNDC